MAAEIKRRTGLAADVVTRSLMALQDRGLVSWDIDADRGVWMLTAAGREAIGLPPAAEALSRGEKAT
jgi:hypothetical protein